MRDFRRRIDRSTSETVICLRLYKDCLLGYSNCIIRVNVADNVTMIAVPVFTSSAISTPTTQNEQARQSTRKRRRQSDEVERLAAMNGCLLACVAVSG